LPQKDHVPKKYKDEAKERQALSDGSEILKCDYKQLANDEMEMRECTANCLGPLHWSEMEYGHLVAISNQQEEGMETSFRTIAYTHSYTLSFTHLH
jgi:hypothetical protein